MGRSKEIAPYWRSFHGTPLEVGQVIAELREKSGLSQLELAKQLGISKVLVVKYESGKVYPRMDVIYDIACCLHCSIDRLYLAMPPEYIDPYIISVMKRMNGLSYRDRQLINFMIEATLEKISKGDRPRHLN